MASPVGPVALIGFGIDSVVEVSSAAAAPISATSEPASAGYDCCDDD